MSSTRPSTGILFAPSGQLRVPSFREVGYAPRWRLHHLTDTPNRGTSDIIDLNCARPTATDAAVTSQ
jgi:hypothetical protein